MADCSNYEEGMEASKLGFDLIATTLRDIPIIRKIGCY